MKSRWLLLLLLLLLPPLMKLKLGGVAVQVGVVVVVVLGMAGPDLRSQFNYESQMKGVHHSNVSVLFSSRHCRAEVKSK